MTMPAVTRRPRPIAATALTICACAAALAACGGSNRPRGADASGHRSAVAYSACMRADGFSSFPDPTTVGSAVIVLSPPVEATLRSPAGRSALRRCLHLMPVPVDGGAQAGPSQQTVQQMLALARCMRGHGLQSFPDPTTTPPPGGLGNGVLDMGGVFLNLGGAGLNPSSPAFQHAAAACRFPGAADLGGAGSTAGTQTS
jgi:hypothetical protein